MIFVTVGNTIPFDRLIRAVDSWATMLGTGSEVFAQIGDGAYEPAMYKFVRFMSPSAYLDRFSKASLIVAHAGMGSIITALELRKPIVVMPRLADRGEHLNEHQLATVRHFRKSPLIKVVESEGELVDLLCHQNAANSTENEADKALPLQREWPPDSSLLNFVQQFIYGAK